MKTAAAACLAILLVSCRSQSPDAAACIPTGTVALASIDLDRLRAAQLYPKLPQSLLTLAETYRAAHQLLIAWNGADLVIIVRGSAPGATAVAPNLAVTGSTEGVRAAIAQYHTGKTGAPALVGYAESTAAGAPLWLTIQGGVALPLAGNTRNLNRLLRDLEFATLAANVDSGVTFRLTAQGRSPEGARGFEENLRAFVSLASAAETRSGALAALLGNVQIRRDALVTTATLNIPASQVQSLENLFNRAL
jgi:hypothetical protein